MANIRHSLGNIESLLLKKLSSAGKNIFTTKDAWKITGSSLPATRLILNGLVEKRWLIRLSAGKYLIVPLSAGPEGEHSENWYVIARNLIEPYEYYISHISALEVHDATIQPGYNIYISTPKRKRHKEVLGATFKFIYVPGDRIWGVEYNWVTPSEKIRVSDIERTIIDCLDRPDLCGGITEVARALWTKRGDLDPEKLKSYVIRFDRQSVIKRLGYLLQLYGIATDTLLQELKSLVSQSYALLDPTLEATGRFISSWKIRVNLDPDEILNSAKT
jgi:predicted transcriptional regulator of viral defense system